MENYTSIQMLSAIAKSIEAIAVSNPNAGLVIAEGLSLSLLLFVGRRAVSNSKVELVITVAISLSLLLFVAGEVAVKIIEACR
ncbi:MAG: hypothetical protein J7647_03755 [Cyanobacteria bacterium SBLK]|nr:hypothetical protein [Cyanobacteria bacterium SBLK]